LQQSLAHYERMLSQSHPTYIQNLNVDFLQARANGDHAAFALAVVTMMMLPPLVPIGVFSMNVMIPRNNDGKLWWFAVIVVTTLCIQSAFLGLVRYWWVTAKRKHGYAL